MAQPPRTSTSITSAICSTASTFWSTSYFLGPSPQEQLSLGSKFAYGVGHVLNDLCASMWFTYLLIFLQKVLLLSSSSAGGILLIGQIADGLSTPVVGYFSDRSGNLWLCKYGRRKTWHLVGTICVATSFPFIFSPCLGCRHSELWVQMMYYSAFVIIFQFGWASVQISHLSLVPELTADEHERTALFAIRYSFTVLSSMVVYIVLFLVLVGKKDADTLVTPKNLGDFQVLAYSMVALGFITSIIFHIGVKELPQETTLPDDKPKNNHKAPERRRNTTSKPKKTWRIFRRLRFYQVATLYMMTRLVANIAQTMFPMYLHEVLKLGVDSIAILPLVMFSLSFLMATVIKPLNKWFGRKVAYCFGAGVGVAVSIWVRLGAGHAYKTYFIYIVAGMYGITASTLLVTSLSITSDMIGEDFDNGAFIYGVMSFTDKLSNGVVVMIIQSWMCWPTCEMHYRDSLVYVCGGASVLGAVAVLSMRNIRSAAGREEEDRHRRPIEEELPSEEKISDSL